LRAALTSNVRKNQGSLGIGIKDMKRMQQESDFELLVNIATNKFLLVPSRKYHKLLFEEKKIVKEIHFGVPLTIFDSTNYFLYPTSRFFI